MNRIQQCFIFAALSLGILLVPNTQVHALTLEHQIEPGFQQVIVQPNKSVFLDYTFTNLKDPGIYQFQIFALSSPNKDGEFQLAPLERVPVSAVLLSRGGLLNEPVLLEEKETFPFRLKIDIPRGTPPGEYAFAIVGRNKPQPAEEGAISAQISNGMGSTFFLTVTEDGIDTPDAGITDFAIGKPVTFTMFGAVIHMFDSNEPIPVTLTFSNQGNFSIIPRGTITLKGSFRKDESFLLLPQYVFPKSQRYASLIQKSDDTCTATYTPDICEQGKTLVLPGYFFGVYELTSAVQMGENEITSYNREHFIVLPYKGLALLLVVLAITGAILARKWIEQSNERPEIVHRKKISRS